MKGQPRPFRDPQRRLRLAMVSSHLGQYRLIKRSPTIGYDTHCMYVAAYWGRDENKAMGFIYA